MVERSRRSAGATIGACRAALEDAAAISPPVLPTTAKDDQGIQNRVDLELGVMMGFPLGTLSSPSPRARRSRPAATRVRSG